MAKFQSAKALPFFLISLKAGGFGLNLTAASYVVLFDPWWNPAVENQAIDRTHRIGQTSKVMAYRLLMKDSIEEKIRQLQHTKARSGRRCPRRREVLPKLDPGRSPLPLRGRVGNNGTSGILVPGLPLPLTPTQSAGLVSVS